MKFAEIIAEVVRFLIPHPQLVLKTNRAVLFLLGRWAFEVGPGWYVAWPCLWQIEEYPSVRTTLNLSGQTLCTADGETVIAAAVVVYRVPSVYGLLAETYEADEALTDMSTAAVAEVVCSYDLDELLRGEVIRTNNLGDRRRRHVR